jgi:uncharacterized protein YjiS (DUF1127 family)
MTSSVPPALLDRRAVGIAARGTGQLRAGLARVVARLLDWHDLARQRQALAALDDHMLKDIGLSRADARQEADRRFWDDGGDPWRIWR